MYSSNIYFSSNSDSLFNPSYKSLSLNISLLTLSSVIVDSFKESPGIYKDLITLKDFVVYPLLTE